MHYKFELLNGEWNNPSYSDKKILELESDAVTIGRNIRNNLAIADTSAQRIHCRIGIEKNRIYIEDFHPRVHTIILRGNELIKVGDLKVPLRKNDILRIGNTDLKLLEMRV